MNDLGAITSITAKILVIVDQVLEKFVTITSAEAPGSGVYNCGINVLSGSLTPCGEALVDSVGDLVYYLVQFGAGFLPALGVTS